MVAVRIYVVFGKLTIEVSLNENKKVPLIVVCQSLAKFDTDCFEILTFFWSFSASRLLWCFFHISKFKFLLSAKKGSLETAVSFKFCDFRLKTECFDFIIECGSHAEGIKFLGH